MLRRIQAKNFRCLRDVDVELDGEFHLLIGPNGAGKTAFMDVLAFLSDFVSDGLVYAITKRTKNFQDLIWGRPRSDLAFELAVEFELPLAVLGRTAAAGQRYRYELVVGEGERGVKVEREQGLLTSATKDARSSASVPRPQSTLVTPRDADQMIFSRYGSDTTCFQFEGSLSENLPFEEWPRIGYSESKSMMHNLPWPQETAFPASTHVKKTLSDVTSVQLVGHQLREPSPPRLRGDVREEGGASLPWMVELLQKADNALFEAWLSHLRIGLRAFDGVRVVERPEDRHAYLLVRFRNGVEVPSWAVSEGTLRLLALTLIAYLPEAPATCLLEEPENGIHPLAVETAYQSLSSVYDANVFVATHSPALLRCAELNEILCFSATPRGTEVTPGEDALELASWRSAIGPELLLASGVRD